MKKIRNGIVMILLLCLLCGCSFAAEKEEDRRDLAYTVVSDDELTAELKDLIETKKAEPFKMTYEDQGYLYIVQGLDRSRRAVSVFSCRSCMKRKMPFIFLRF